MRHSVIETVEKARAKLTAAPQPRSVLLVEDDPLDADYIASMLLDLGVDVVHTDRAQQAKALLDQKTFRLVILDYQLINGVATEVVRWIRENKPFVPVVILTGMDHLPDKIRHEILGEGALTICPKPIREETLLQLLAIFHVVESVHRYGFNGSRH
jgi:DNA-binding response OmpR family regulator